MRQTSSTKGKIIIALLALCLSVSYFSSWKEHFMRHFLYPLQYDHLVRQYAYENHVDPALVAAVILVESKFDEQAASHRGAVGLMQIMPDTGQWIADEMELPGYTPERLSDVDVNIQMGAWYLGYLLNEYDGNKVLALAAYNAGRGYVDDWIKEYGWEKNFTKVDEIPFSETRNYVKIVLLNEKQYSHLYNF